MKKILLAAAASLLSVAAFAQSDFDISKDKENGMTVYKGALAFDDLKKESTFGWFQRGATAYTPDSNAVKYLKKNLPQYNLVVLMGTWCDDSHNLIPKLYKTLQAAGYPMKQIRLYGVDRAKQAKYVEHRLYQVEKVPTIILQKQHTEVGRVVETVKRSVEVDLVQLIQSNLDAQEASKQ